MTLEVLLSFIAMAAYFQTVTGFGLGMIVMGATSGMSRPWPLWRQWSA